MHLERLRKHTIPPVDHDYDWKDIVLYALGLGYGSDPLDPDQLQFVYEDGLKPVPSICNTLSHPGFWLQAPELEIDWVKILHGEQAFEMHHPLPTSGRLRGEYEILSVEDKGADKGAVLTIDKTLTDRDSGLKYFTVRTTVFMRGDGGQGGFGTPPAPPLPVPGRAPDVTVEFPTLPQSALIYRLNGDFNPIHASPDLARKAGFDRPVLHGLCTMGLAARALLEGVCDNEPACLRSMFVRFSRPVFPGETIRTEILRDGNTVRFRSFALERDVLILDRGQAVIA